MCILCRLTTPIAQGQYSIMSQKRRFQAKMRDFRLRRTIFNALCEFLDMAPAFHQTCSASQHARFAESRRLYRQGSSGRVETWRGGLGEAYLLPALSSAGASIAPPCSVSTSRSSNRTCGSPASGSPSESQAFAFSMSDRRVGTGYNPSVR